MVPAKTVRLMSGQNIRMNAYVLVISATSVRKRVETLPREETSGTKSLDWLKGEKKGGEGKHAIPNGQLVGHHRPRTLSTVVK